MLLSSPSFHYILIVLSVALAAKMPSIFVAWSTIIVLLRTGSHEKPETLSHITSYHVPMGAP